MEYTSEIKKLDCIYLDTTFTDDIHFPTKAEGLAELLKKIKKYPADTIFHFTAWTFGYEEVWIALSKAMKSPIHVDQYKLSLYESLCPKPSKSDATTNPAYLAAEAPALIGHQYGNNYQKGCLTLDPTVRIHSCEKGVRCPAITTKTVFIQPILARGTNGVEMLEMGAGGGRGDLAQTLELEIDSDVFVERVSGFFKNASKGAIDEMKSELKKRLANGRNTISLEDMGIDNQTEEMSLEELVKAAMIAVPKQSSQVEPIHLSDEELPRTITFPYSRHASYEECCDLVSAFKPLDVYPCTVDERKWFAGVTMASLFGQYCDGGFIYRHDKEMQAKYGKPVAGDTETQQVSQDCAISDESALNNFEISIPVQSHKRKAEDSFSSPDKHTRELSPDLDEENFLTELRNQQPRESDAFVDIDAMSNDISDESNGSNESGGSDDELETNLPDSHDMAFWQHSDDEAANNFWDPVDKVWRCKECGWEKWYRLRDCECKGGLGVLVQCDDEMTKEGFRRMHVMDGNGTPADIDLMDSASCYDSVSNASGDEYEKDSFIDDGRIEPESEENEAEKDEDYEVDYKEKYLEALKGRNMLNKECHQTNSWLLDVKEERLEWDTDYDTDLDYPDLPKEDDSDSEARAEDPDYRYLWEKMEKKKIAALKRSLDKHFALEAFKRSAPGYVSERDGYNSAYDENFDSEIDIPRASAPFKDDDTIGMSGLQKSWSHESEVFLKLHNELLATKKTFRELRQTVLHPEHDKYRDSTGNHHRCLMDQMIHEPKPYGQNIPTGDFGDDFEGWNWGALWKRARRRRVQIQSLLTAERKAFKEWRRSHKEDYIENEDPYDSEYPTTIEEEKAAPNYADLDVESIHSEASEWDSRWWYRYDPEVPPLASEGMYRKVWSQCCRAFRHLKTDLAQAKKGFKRYRDFIEEDGEIDAHIEIDIEKYGDKLLSLEHEPRPFGSGKLGPYGNDERGWDWKGLAEKGCARLQQMRRELKREDEAFTNWRINHAQEYESDSDCDSVNPDPGKGRFEGLNNYGSNDGMSMDGMSDIGPVSDMQPRNSVIDNGVEASKHAVCLPKTLKQSLITDYFSAGKDRPWYLVAKEKARRGPRSETHEEHIHKQRRISQYLNGGDKLKYRPFNLPCAVMRLPGETPEERMQDMMQAGVWHSHTSLFKRVKEPLGLQVPPGGAIDEALPKLQNEVAAEQSATDGSDDDYKDNEEPTPQPANRQSKKGSLQQIFAGVRTVHDRQAAAHAAQNGAPLLNDAQPANNDDSDASMEL